MTLALAEGDKVSRKRNPVGFFLSHTSQLTSMNIDVVLKLFMVTILRLLQSEMFVVKGNNYCIINCSTHKNPNQQHQYAFEHLLILLIQNWYNDGHY